MWTLAVNHVTLHLVLYYKIWLKFSDNTSVAMQRIVFNFEAENYKNLSYFLDTEYGRSINVTAYSVCKCKVEIGKFYQIR